jgi:SAM-dependent methyltransferase
LFTFKLKNGVEWVNNKFLNTVSSDNLYHFSENMDGWNDDLTLLHDVEKLHPIDLNSIDLTINDLNKIITSQHEEIILEIGSSNGNLIHEINKNGRYNFIGTDVVDLPLTKLSNKYCNIPFIRCDINNNPFINESVDCIICLNVLEHIENDSKALSEINKILKYNGKLILELPYGENLYDNYDKFLKHFRRYSTVDIINKSVNSNFEIIKIEYMGILIYPFFYLHKKIISKLKFFKPKVLIKSSSGKFFKFLLNLDFYINKLKLLKFGIRIRLILIKK